MGIEQLEMELTRLIQECLGISIEDREKNLLDKETEVVTVDWLYVFSEIERRYHVAPELMIDGDYEYFTIQGIAKRIVGKMDESRLKGEGTP